MAFCSCPSSCSEVLMVGKKTFYFINQSQNGTQNSKEMFDLDPSSKVRNTIKNETSTCLKFHQRELRSLLGKQKGFFRKP